MEILESILAFMKGYMRVEPNEDVLQALGDIRDFIEKKLKEICNHESHFISSMNRCEKCGDDKEWVKN